MSPLALTLLLAIGAPFTAGLAFVAPGWLAWEAVKLGRALARAVPPSFL